jgi:ring-1,2-phenylacetyl-CoA epoxidase subunit PaaC
MNPTVQTALLHKLLALADDELILSHRNAEWIGHGPILEEDIAIGNIAQDELGHATVWYGLYCELTGDDPDALVFLRDPADFRNVQMMELPKGDWAFTMLRQYLFDAYEVVMLAALPESTYQPLAEAVAKIRNEEIYHYRHTTAWIRRLGRGTEESHCRLQNALDELWPFVQQLFVPLPDEVVLVEEGIVGETADLHTNWQNLVLPHLTDSGLTIPSDDTPITNSRSQHTSHLTHLLNDMQLVARLDKEARW